MIRNYAHKPFRTAYMKEHQYRVRGYLGAFLLCLPMLMGSFAALAADNAQLVSVSIQPGTQIMPRTMFTQTWTFTNTGTTTWTPGLGYTLNIIGLDSLGALSLFTNTSPGRYITSAVINGGKSVPPGGKCSYSMAFIAPEAAGTYTDTFQLNSASSVFFGPQVTVQIVVPQAGSTNQFDRSKAISYANNDVGYVCTDGYFWTNGNFSDCIFYGVGSPVPTTVIGDDCAHFVSCCIGKQSTTNRGGGLNIITRAPTGCYGEPSAQRIIYTNLIGGGYATEVYSLSQMAPGDVVGWNWSGDPNPANIDHVTLYMGNGLVAAHATSHLDMSMSYYLSGSPTPAYHLIHIFDSPTIAASKVGNKLILSWGTNWTGYTLYSASSLSHGATWTKITKSPSKVGALNFMTNTMTGVSTFYRLSMP